MNKWFLQKSVAVFVSSSPNFDCDQESDVIVLAKLLGKQSFRSSCTNCNLHYDAEV